jgi:hypothetical protein
MMSNIFKNISSPTFCLTLAMRRSDFAANIDMLNFDSNEQSNMSQGSEGDTRNVQGEG